MKSLLMLAFAALSFTGCVSIQSVSLTSIPAQRGTEVHSEAKKVVVLGLNFSNDFVDQLTNDLAQQCPGGQVRGILTKDEVVNYFLMIVYQRRVTASGYCLAPTHTALAMSSAL